MSVFFLFHLGRTVSKIASPLFQDSARWYQIHLCIPFGADVKVARVTIEKGISELQATCWDILTMKTWAVLLRKHQLAVPSVVVSQIQNQLTNLFAAAIAECDHVQQT